MQTPDTMPSIEVIEHDPDPAPGPASGPVACPAGFVAGGAAAGVKPERRPDVGLLAVEGARDGADAAAAVVLTRNRMRAACVDRSAGLLQREGARGGRVQVLVIQSGNANCATGEAGRRHDERLAAAAAAATGADPERTITFSTGTIGVPLPIERLERALPDLGGALAADGLRAFAQATLTTDTRTKIVTVPPAEGRPFTVVGTAKGSGMIHPDMATMIGTLLTDAEVEPAVLDRVLGRVVDRTFNRISVDGDTSTNDGVIALASGRAGPAGEEALEAALLAASDHLSRLIVADGEGVHRTILVEVAGAASEDDADRAARTIATSLLVRTAVTGGDPNWGRILAAAGRSGAAFDADRATVRAGGLEIYRDGTPLEVDAGEATAAFRADEVTIAVDLGLGDGRAHFRSCDLTSEYVRINAEDMT